MTIRYKYSRQRTLHTSLHNLGYMSWKVITPGFSWSSKLKLPMVRLGHCIAIRIPSAIYYRHTAMHWLHDKHMHSPWVQGRFAYYCGELWPQCCFKVARRCRGRSIWKAVMPASSMGGLRGCMVSVSAWYKSKFTTTNLVAVNAIHFFRYLACSPSKTCCAGHPANLSTTGICS